MISFKSSRVEVSKPEEIEMPVTDDDDDDDATIDHGSGPLCPEVRAHRIPSGFPITSGAITSGSAAETWLLSPGGIASVLDGFRDRMDDQCRLSDQVNMLDVFEAGLILLRGNYDLTTGEAVAIMQGADPKTLTAQVMAALFGSPRPHRTYTAWVMSSLYAAGLDPEKIPPEWIPQVMDQLVRTDRAVPITEYTDAALAAPRLKAMRARVADKAAALAAAEAATTEAATDE